MVICNECKMGNTDSAQYCGNCGKPLKPHKQNLFDEPNRVTDHSKAASTENGYLYDQLKDTHQREDEAPYFPQMSNDYYQSRYPSQNQQPFVGPQYSEASNTQTQKQQQSTTSPDKKKWKISFFRTDDRFTQIILKLIPPFASVVITFIFLKIVAATSNEYLHRLLWPNGDWYQKAVPVLTVFLFVWSLNDLLLKFISNWVSKNHLSVFQSFNFPSAISKDQTAKILEQFATLPSEIKNGYVCKRIFSLIKNLQFLHDVQRSHEFFRHQSELDSDNASSGYTLVKLFIWAMPILGFIGTVMGIGISVGNFSGFLIGDIDNIDLVKLELSKVSTGLSFAFDTTLLGLVAALFTMIFTSFIQKNEELFLSELETLGLKIISNSKKGSKGITGEQPIETPESKTMLEEKVKELTNHLAVILSNFSTNLGAHITHLSKNATIFSNMMMNINPQQISETIGQTISVFKTEINNIATTMIGTMEKLAFNTAKTTNEVNARISAVPEKFKEECTFIENSFSGIFKNASELSNTLENSSQKLNGTLSLLAQQAESVKSSKDVTMKIADSIDLLNSTLCDMKETQQKLMPLLIRLDKPLKLKVMQQESDEYEINQTGKSS